MLVRVGRTTDVPAGAMRAFQVAGTAVTVANADGRLYAIDDTCTHLGCSLATGELQGTTVTCPCHGSEFDIVSGDVLEGPAEYPVRSRAVDTTDGELSIES